jgi:hypothetical protein
MVFWWGNILENGIVTPAAASLSVTSVYAQLTSIPTPTWSPKYSVDIDGQLLIWDTQPDYPEITVTGWALVYADLYSLYDLFDHDGLITMLDETGYRNILPTTFSPKRRKSYSHPDAYQWTLSAKLVEESTSPTVVP